VGLGEIRVAGGQLGFGKLWTGEVEIMDEMSMIGSIREETEETVFPNGS